MSQLVLDFFQLVLEVHFNFTSDIVHKSDKFSQAFLEESLELFSVWKHNSITFDVIFVLLLTKKVPIFEETNCKRYTLMTFSFSYFEIVFTLLTEVVIF